MDYFPDIQSALDEWEWRRDVKELARAIPIEPIRDNFPRWFKMLDIFLSQLDPGSSTDLPPPEIFRTHHVTLAYALQLLLGALAEVKPPHPEGSQLARRIVPHVEPLIAHLLIVCRGIGIFHLVDEGLRSMGSKQHLVIGVVTTIGTLITWDQKAESTGPVSTSVLSSTRAAHLMAWLWSLNRKTCLPAQKLFRMPPDLMRLVDGTPACPVLAAMRAYLSDAHARRIFFREWIIQCRDGTIYGFRVDPGATFASTIISRLNRISTTLATSPTFSEEFHNDYFAFLRILTDLYSNDGLRGFPSIADGIVKAGVTRLFLKHGKQISVGAAKDTPALCVFEPTVSMRTGTPTNAPIPLVVFTTLASIRNTIDPRLRDGLQWYQEGIWVSVIVEVLVDTLGTFQHIPVGQPGNPALHFYVEWMVSELLSHAVAYPSLLKSTQRALRSIPRDRSQKAARVRVGAICPFEVLSQRILQSTRMHAAFEKKRLLGDVQTVLCDNSKHPLVVQQKHEAGSPQMQTRSCTGCHAMVYCSRQCQREDWQDRHEHECAVYGSSRIAAEAEGTWYRSSFRMWHFYMQSFFFDVALAAGPNHITMINFMDKYHISTKSLSVEAYPFRRLGRGGKSADPRCAKSTAADDMNARVAAMIQDTALRHEAEQSGSERSRRQRICLIEGVFPWCPIGEGIIYAMGQYSITPSASPERDWDVELLTHAARVSSLT